MNREQLKYMRERISSAKQKLQPWKSQTQDQPAAVVKAYAVIDAWSKKREAIADARRSKILTLVRDAEEAMLFLSNDDAIKKVKELEALVGKV